MEILLHTVLNVDKSRGPPRTQRCLATATSSIPAVGSDVAKHVSPLIPHKAYTWQTDDMYSNPTLSDIDLLRDAVPPILCSHLHHDFSVDHSSKSLLTASSNGGFYGISID